MNFERIPLSKEMFVEAKEKRLTLSEVLRAHEKFDREAESKGFSPLVQQLAARGLALSGTHAALVDDFFKTEDNKLLFAETINEAVRIGMMEELKSFVNLNELVATKTGIGGTIYQGAEVDLDNSAASSRRVGERGEFPSVVIKFKDKAIKLVKNGYRIEATYEAIRRIKINVFAVTMKVLGRNIARDKVAIAADVLINGDGNSNPIGSINAAVSGTLAYKDVVNLQEEFEYFEPSLMIAPKAMRVAYLNLAEYKDKNGPSMPEPPKKCAAVPASKIIALDAKAALEEVFEQGGSMVEYDKIIAKQIQEAVVSEVSGYAKLFPEASKMLNVTF
ncbi:MAG: hypothetical protein EPN93_17445 [Spirochaetes bacterium]|nr:MAG: hypothetical protein EPN93_17445 [Spirochaetota bacterium]